MAEREYTSAEVASIAARGVRDPWTLNAYEVQAVCASALTQTRDHLDADQAQLPLEAGGG